MAINWVGEEEFKEIEKKNLLEEALEQCDWEILERYNYINEQLDNTSDLIAELMKAREGWKVEREIAKRMKDNEQKLQIDMKIKEVYAALDDMEEKYEILHDLRDEMELELLGMDTEPEVDRIEVRNGCGNVVAEFKRYR